MLNVEYFQLRTKMPHFSFHSITGSSIFQSILLSEKQTKRTSDLPIVFSKAYGYGYGYGKPTTVPCSWFF